MTKRTTKIPKSLEWALGLNVRLGYLEVWGLDVNGEPLYKVTPEGEARVQKLLDDNEGDGE